MGGRGRSKTTLSREQLQALNVKGNECLPVILEPPPTYPAPMTRPSPFPEGKKYQDQMLKMDQLKKEMTKRQFLDGLHANSLLANKIPHYSNENLIMLNKLKYRFIVDFHWERMPEELRTQRPKSHRKIRKKDGNEVPDIEKRLEELAAKENALDDSAEAENKRRDSDKEEDEDDAEIDEQEEDDFDDDNDYGNNYFDNGEDYDDNVDEPLDDGPVY